MRQLLGIALITFSIAIIQGCGILKGNDSSEASAKNKKSASVQEPQKLPERKRLAFDNHFFEGLKERHIGNTERAISKFRKCLELKPTAATVHYELSTIYKEKHSLDTALRYAKNAVKYSDSQYWFMNNLADIYRLRKEYGKAAEEMENILDAHYERSGPDFYYELANMYLRQNKLQKGLNVYNRFEKRFGINPQVTNQKKRIYLRLNKVEKAAEEIKKLIENDPDNLEYHRQLASIYMANKKYEKALEVYEKMLEIKPGNGEAQMALAEFYTHQGKKEKAFEYLKKAFKNPGLSIDQKVQFMLSKYLSQGFQEKYKEEAFTLARILTETHPNNAKSHAIYGDFLYQDNQFKKALEQYEESIKYKQDNFAVWQNLLQINYRLNNYEELKSKSDQALALFPNQPILYFFNGIANKETGDPEKAVQVFKTGLSLNLNDQNLKTQFYSNLAMTYHEMEEYEKSDKYFEKALTLNPNDPYILNNYSWYLALRGDKLAKAEKMSKKSLELQPNSAAYLDTYGWIQYKQGDLKKAKEYIGKALEQSPNDPELLEHYGDVLYKLDQRDKAVKFWKKARKNGTSSEKLDKKIADRKLYD